MTRLPIGWTKSTLGKVVKLRGEKQHPRSNPDAPFVGLENVEAHTSRVLRYDRAGDMKSAAARFEPGDILYSRLRPYLNKVFRADKAGLASAEFLVLEASSAIEGEYVRRRIMATDFLAFTAGLDRGDRPRVDFEQISGFPINLPPIAEQRRIVAKLDSLTARTAKARSELDQLPKLIERYRSQALERLIVEFTRTAQRLPLSELVDRTRGIPYGIVLTGTPRPGGVPTVRCGDIKHFQIDRSALKRVSPDIDAQFQRTKLRGGEVLLSIRGTVGNVAIAGPELRGCNISREVALIPPLENLDPRFLMFFLASASAQSFLRRHIKGVAQSGINLEDVRALPTPIPSIEAQRQLIGAVTSMFAWLDNVEAEHTRASHLLPKLDQAILAKAFRGELVPQDPNDEPASMLLERIRKE